MNGKNALTKQYYHQIYEWVADNYGENEAEDPSWNIEALANHLTNRAYSVYDIIELASVREDMEYVCEGWAKKPTEKQLDDAVALYTASDSYRSLDQDAMEWYIKKAMKPDNN